MPAQVRVSSLVLFTSLERKGMIILSGLEQAQEDPHGSIHLEVVQVARVGEVRLLWRQVEMEKGFSG